MARLAAEITPRFSPFAAKVGLCGRCGRLGRLVL
jgi:hypothetical protein